MKEYLTTVGLDEMDSAFKPGMSAKTEILVDRLTNVLTVPLQAIFTGGGETYVYVGDAARYEKRPVEVGLSSSTQAEVKSGLTAGEHVLLSRPKDAAADSDSSQRAKKDDKDAKESKDKNGGSGGTGGGGGRAGAERSGRGGA